MKANSQIAIGTDRCLSPLIIKIVCLFCVSQQTELIGVNESKERRIISSEVRERFSASFLEAKEAQGVLLQSRIPVDFKGNTHKPSTGIHVN